MSAGDDSSSPVPGGTRTYVRRRGRLTRGQARALAHLSDRYILELGAAPLDLEALFGRRAPVGVEIGFGMGHALLDWARDRPDWNLIGIEVYQPGLGAAMLGMEREGLDNVRLLEAPAEDVLQRGFAPGSIDEIRIFFPDPWPKKRHYKRRLVQAELTALAADRLAPGGLVWVATDWEPYAEWIVDVLDAEPALEPTASPRVEDDDAARAVERPRTRFEARGTRLGHRVWDLRYRRKR